MKKQIPLDQVAGKTITGITAPDSSKLMVIAFSDDTFTAVGIDFSCDREDATLVGVTLERHDLCSMESLVEIGVLTQDEFDCLRAERVKAAEAAALASDRKQYERLRAKFEGHHDDAPAPHTSHQ